MTRSMASSMQGGSAWSRWLLFCAGVTLSVLVGVALHVGAQRVVDSDAGQRFESKARSAQASVETHIKEYTDVVHAVAALFHSRETQPTRLEFHRFVESLKIDKHFPAIEGVSFARHLTEAQRERFEAAVRADRSLEAGGYPEFAVHPPGPRERYTVLTYLEPMAPLRERLGLDIGAEPLRARLLDLARDTGQLSASGLPVVLAKPAPHLGLAMRLPLYRVGLPLDTIEQRRAAYFGSAGIGFSVPGLVQSALSETAVGQIATDLYADLSHDPEKRSLVIGKDDRVLYESGASATQFKPGEIFETVLPVEFHGSLWKLRLRVARQAMYTEFDRIFPVVTFLTGFSSTMLMYAFFHTLFRSRRSAIEQRHLLDSVLDSVDAHVYMKGRDRRYLYINARTAEAMGASAEDIIGKLDSEVLPQARADFYWEQDLPIFSDGKRRAGQLVEFTQRDGSLRQLWTVKVPIKHNGEVTAVIGLSTDVTALHQLKAQADAANRAKSNFLSNMSHEIRTPMNSIIGMSHLALKSVTNPKQRDYLEKIHHAGQHLLGIINDILDFSKIEAGKLELEVVDFGLATLMQNIANQLGEAAASKKLELNIDIEAGLAHQLRGDPLRLEQVLLNFTSNAIKFSENGQVHIRTRVLEEGEQDMLVRFEVQDKGIGMSEAEVADLFKSFHQADPSTTRKYGGTGLGLVICKQLAELMGGAVGVQSAPGTGSTFWFTARLGKAHNFLRQGGEEVAQDVLDLLAGARLLLVEDNVFSQQVGKELLENVHASVVLASNGKEAIDLMLRQRFDCVLMDVQMPVMDGFEATRMIRSDPRLRGAVVIALTANAGKDDQQRCMEAGMNEFITKPILPNLLFQVIARWLRTRPEPKPAPPAPSTPAGRPDLIDMAALSLTFGGNPAKMRKYAMLFLDSARDALAAIEDALAQGDIGRVAELSLRLKSSAKAVGAFGFANLCDALAETPAIGPRDEARALLARLGEILLQLGEHIEREVVAPEA